MVAAFAVGLTVPVAGVLLFLVLPWMERWLDADDANGARTAPSPRGSDSTVDDG